MINSIVALGYGIIVLAVVIGVGTVVLYNFGGATACSGDFSTWNSTADKCQNSTGSQVTPSSVSWTNTNYLTKQLGQSGLAGWVPALVAVSIGMLFLGFFAIGKGSSKTGRY